MAAYIGRFTHDYSRRLFLSRLAKGIVSLGVTAPLWKTLAAHGDATGAYPDELLSIEAYTKGVISTGGYIDANNVDLVKELLDPIRYRQIKEMGRVLEVVPPTTDIMALSPWEYIEATLKNQGKARFDNTGNVVTLDGDPWIGGSSLNLFVTLHFCLLSICGHTSPLYCVFPPLIRLREGWRASVNLDANLLGSTLPIKGLGHKPFTRACICVRQLTRCEL